MAPGSSALAGVLAVAMMSSAVYAQQPGAPTPSPARPQAQDAGKPGVVFADVVAAQATVVGVDKARRTVTLRGDDGREITIKAGPKVQNFDQIEKGDKVTAEYYEATAIFARKPEAAAGAPSGAGQTPMATQQVEVAPPGQKPAGLMTDVTEVVATVEDIDYAKRQMTLKGPGGGMRSIGVGHSVQNLESIKKGDEIVVRHTEALAIAVTK